MHMVEGSRARTAFVACWCLLGRGKTAVVPCFQGRLYVISGESKHKMSKQSQKQRMEVRNVLITLLH